MIGTTTAVGAAEISPLINLPGIISAAEFLAVPLEMPAVIVGGMIRRESVVMFASASKSYKTWTLIHLALCVSRGVPWLGKDTTKGRVLFLNFELPPAEFQFRLKAIVDAIAIVYGIEAHCDFDIWNLRGHAADIERLMPHIIKGCEDKNYAMIIPDPIYSMLGARNENAANEMADFLSHLSRLSEATKAAVIYTHHFAKGSASAKEQIDRFSGSGVFARHADGIVTLTRHEEDNAFVVEAELRSFPRMPAFCVKWEHPLMGLDFDLNPKKLKGSSGAKVKYTVVAIVDCLTDGMTTGEWMAAAALKEGVGASTFAKIKNKAEAEGRVEAQGKKWVRIRKVVSYDVMTGEKTVRDAGEYPGGLQTAA